MAITLKRVKRDQYLEAWDKIVENSYNKMKGDWRFKHVWPGRFKDIPKTEVDNFCTVAYDGDRPVGVFGMSLTKRGQKLNLLGKQIAADPNYMGRGIGQALLIENEAWIRDEHPEVEGYVITCLDTTSGIFHHKWGLDPLKSGTAVQHENGKEIVYGDKYWVPLHRDGWNDLHKKIMTKLNNQ